MNWGRVSQLDWTSESNSSPRLSQCNQHPVRGDRDFVLYWMIASRRTRYNFALQHAIEWAQFLSKPLVVFEPLRTRYRWASDRMHRFVIEGMRDNAKALEKSPITYFPYVEPQPGVGTPLLHQLARHACLVVTDEFPCFFLPHMIAAVKDRIPARLEQVDGNGIVPLRISERTFTVAHSYRRWMQKNVLDWLVELPKQNPVARLQLPRLEELPDKVTRRWKPADFDALLAPGGLDDIPIDHDVSASETFVGGSAAAGKRWTRFLDESFEDYDEQRNHPDARATTGLSSYLHFGHISAHQMVSDILDRESWTPDRCGPVNGKNSGFWNVSPAADGLLDQLLTWRELGFNLSFREPERYDRFESLPDWAQKTLTEHTSDARPSIYSLDQFTAAKTHDPIWNAAQRQLVREGVIHNYLRMLWGKKILHWTESPHQAMEFMIELNNRFALDGRDPNSYNGIFWVLGRYDRAWGPKRPVFGSVRYMTSDSTRKKLKLSKYLAKYAADNDSEDA